MKQQYITIGLFLECHNSSRRIHDRRVHGGNNGAVRMEESLRLKQQTYAFSYLFSLQMLLLSHDLADDAAIGKFCSTGVRL